VPSIKTPYPVDTAGKGKPKETDARAVRKGSIIEVLTAIKLSRT
jgi:hypothetical protein